MNTFSIVVKAKMLRKISSRSSLNTSRLNINARAGLNFNPQTQTVLGPLAQDYGYQQVTKSPKRALIAKGIQKAFKELL